MSYQANIDWAWGNFDPPQRAVCLAYVISSDPMHPIFRGTKTGNECVLEAIRAARVGDRSTALNWLMASQCHNDAAREEIHGAGNAAIDYAVSTYG